MSFRKGVTFILILILAVGISCLPASGDSNVPKVKIGFYDDGDYMSVNKNGDYIGFNFEYLQEITKHTGWEYEIVDCRSWTNAWDMLVNGEIDILPAVYMTEERLEKVLFPDEQMCEIYTTLNVREDDLRYGYQDFDSFQGMAVGVVKDSVDAENFKKYFAENNVKYSLKEFEETHQLLDALTNGDIDAIAITHLGRNSIFRSVAQFSPDSVYIAVSKEQPKLFKELDKALLDIKMRAPYYEAKLYEKYFSVSKGQKPVFTKEEQEFIENSGVIRAIYNPERFPVSYTNSKTGEFAGIVADVFKIITENTGLTFEFVPERDYATAMGSIYSQDVELFCHSGVDYIFALKNNINATSSYLSAPIRMVRSPNSQSIDRIALHRGYAISNQIADQNPDSEHLYYGTVEECFEALLNDEADVFHINSYIASSYLSNPRYGRFTATTMTSLTEDLGIGVSKTSDHRLFSIMDRCVQYISSETMDELIFTHSQMVRQITLSQFLKENPLESIVFIFGISAIIVILLLYALYMQGRSQSKIEKLLYRDALTDLWNLNKFTIEAKAKLKGVRPDEYVLVYMDINQFTALNDTLGFAEGDKILRTMGILLNTNLKLGEFCARVSADRFVMLWQYRGWDKLVERTEQIDRLLNDRLDVVRKYQTILAFGAYIVQGTEDADISLMLDFASYARKTAKKSHKNRTVLYDAKMRAGEIERRGIESVMVSALANGEFCIYIQPKIKMESGKVVGGEALVRWNHPEKGLILPGGFIPLFEENGFVVEIDLFVYEQVCKLICKGIRSGATILPMSCNFSSLHFKNEEFPQQLAEIAARYEVPTSYLEVEITESVIIEDLKHTQEYCERLKELGFLIAIDDFGSGYSSLAVLQELGVDVLKLDRSFLNHGIEGKRDQVVLRAIITAAKALGMLVVCEGVENTAQAKRLIEMGCTVAQSFYYARPMPTDIFEEFIKNKNEV